MLKFFLFIFKSSIALDTYILTVKHSHRAMLALSN